MPGRILPRAVTFPPSRFGRPLVRALVLLGAASAVGCLEETPPPPKQHDSGVVQPQPDGGAPDLDGGEAEVAPPGDGGTEAWAGTWQYVSGAAGVTCGGSFSLQGVEGFLVIEATSFDGLAITSDGCKFRFVLSAETATKTPPGQACPKWAVPIIPEWTLTMLPDGTLDERLGGPVSLGGETCTISGRATLRRQ